jgi:hypothetical protein
MPRRPLAMGEKWLLGAVLGLLAVGVVVLVISLAAGGRSTGHGCVDVKLPGATGTTEFYRCGRAARDLCASTQGRRGVGSINQAIAAQCRKARIPTG